MLYCTCVAPDMGALGPLDTFLPQVAAGMYDHLNAARTRPHLMDLFGGLPQRLLYLLT